MRLPSFSLEGKIAIVTGGKRGIGRTIGLTFAEAGADVVVCGRTPTDLEKVAEEIRALGRRSLAVRTDVSIKTDVENLIAQTVSEFGTIDIFVNNAMVDARHPLLKAPEEAWDKLMSTGLKGYFLCSQAVARVMRERKRGNIINIASGAGVKVAPGNGIYGVAKAGVIMLTKYLALELAHHNIRVNAISPSLVKTEFTETLWSDPDMLSRLVSRVPLGRIMDVSELAGAALFLASDASSYITGHNLVIDGGMTA